MTQFLFLILLLAPRPPGLNRSSTETFTSFEKISLEQQGCTSNGSGGSADVVDEDCCKAKADTICDVEGRKSLSGCIMPWHEL